MRLSSWFARQLSALRKVIADYRTDPRALLFAAGLITITYGLWEVHPPTAKIVFGTLLIADAVLGRPVPKK